MRLVLRRKLKISTEVKNSSPLMTEALFSVSLERIVESRENSSVKKGFPNHIFFRLPKADGCVTGRFSIKVKIR